MTTAAIQLGIGILDDPDQPCIICGEAGLDTGTITVVDPDNKRICDDCAEAHSPFGLEMHQLAEALDTLDTAVFNAPGHARPGLLKLALTGFDWITARAQRQTEAEEAGTSQFVCLGNAQFKH